MSNLSRETPKRPELPPSIPPFFRELMERCWHPDALQRPSFEDIAATMKDLDTTTVTQMLFNQVGEGALHFEGGPSFEGWAWTRWLMTDTPPPPL